MLPINAIRDPRKATRGDRAKRALALLSRIKGVDLPDTSMRWETWRSFHHEMLNALNVDSIQHFQADPRIGSQICGGGGQAYIKRLHDRFGHPIQSFFLSTYRETLCGDPQDLTCADGCYITRTSMRALYHLAALHQFCKNYYSGPIDFVEVGGGFGNLARMVHQYSLARRYFIIDYPATLALQYFFVTEFFDEEHIALWNGNEYLAGNDDSKICLVTPDAVAQVSTKLKGPTVLLSTMAMTEIPGPGQQYYLDQIPADAVYIFGQTQTMAVAHGKHLQNVKAVSNTGLFNDLSKRCHVVEFTRGDYYTEFLGLFL